MNTSTTSVVPHKIIIIGSGPAGLTAAIYAARANLEPIVFAGVKWGGQLMDTTDIENFPGFPEGIPGPELMANMVKQAQRFGAQVLYENVVEVDLSSEVKIVKTAKQTYQANAVIFAMGSEPRMLRIPGEDTFYGRGVSTCATCDGAFYRNKIVAVVGGGDSAMEEANFLTRFASKVYLVHRKDSFRASDIMVDRVKANPKVEILYNTELTEVVGGELEVNPDIKIVKSVKTVNNKTNETSELAVDGVFLAIGHIPVTGLLKDKIPLDEQGYVSPLSFGSVKTNIDGVFIAGEVQDYTYKQAITTAADGCKAALEAERWLETKGL